MQLNKVIRRIIKVTKMFSIKEIIKVTLELIKNSLKILKVKTLIVVIKVLKIKTKINRIFRLKEINQELNFRIVNNKTNRQHKMLKKMNKKFLIKNKTSKNKIT